MYIKFTKDKKRDVELTSMLHNGIIDVVIYIGAFITVSIKKVNLTTVNLQNIVIHTKVYASYIN